MDNYSGYKKALHKRNTDMHWDSNLFVVSDSLAHQC